MRNAPRICWLSLPNVASSARLLLSRKNASSTCSMWAQVRLNLAADLRQQHAFLRALAHLVQHGCTGRGGRPASPRGIQARQHRIDLLREIGAEARIVLEGGLGKQQRRRVFHRHRFRNPRRRHLVDALDQRRRQLHQRAVVNLRRLRVHRRQRLLQLRQVFGAPRGGLQPRVLGARKLFARFAQQRLQAHDVGRQGLRRKE